MSIPFVRSTYATGTPVASFDLNQLQDFAMGELPIFFDDFWISVLSSPLWSTVIDGTGSVGGRSGDTLAVLQTDATNAHKTAILSPTVATLARPNKLGFRARFKIVSSLVNRIDELGYVDSATSALLFGFQRDSLAGTTLHLVFQAIAGLITFDTGFSPSVDTWYTFYMYVKNVNEIIWAIGTDGIAAPLAGGPSAPVAVGSGVGGATALKWHAQVKTQAAAVREIDLDFVALMGSRS